MWKRLRSVNTVLGTVDTVNTIIHYSKKKNNIRDRLCPQHVPINELQAQSVTRGVQTQI